MDIQQQDNGKWIWYFGEYEHYHNLLVHNRREQYGYQKPSMWKLYAPEPVVRFHVKRETAGGEIRIYAKGDYSVTVGDHPRTMKRYEGQSIIHLEPGITYLSVTVANHFEFPCLYISGALPTDEGWMADDLTADTRPVGSYAYFDTPEKLPTVFPFAYKEIDGYIREEVNDGVLFDFSKEIFAEITLSARTPRTVFVSYGESREEALDREWSVIHFEVTLENGSPTLAPRALRYLFISDPDVTIKARYEYLPLEYRGSFHCDDEVITKVWEVAAYTFHLNSREFFLDGIKRDRWVWSADAYQSLFVNRYLFHDPDIEKRTLIALGGKVPVKAHINTIMDYSFFWIISLHEYYITYGDLPFIKAIYPQMKAVMDFCRGRVSEDGFVRGMDQDWVFIDWAPMDKIGALCGEQILFAKALSCYAMLCDLAGHDSKGAKEQSEQLQHAIIDRFLDTDKKVFIDSFESGQRHVTRHSNILAYLFLPLSDAQKADIYTDVIQNDAVAQITTPYFKFYENQVHCEHGNDKMLETAIRDYYGSMLALGATTLYEAYDPNQSGNAHYSMYGFPYEKSLCHAWSASPIYLLGAYRMGVKNTGIAYDHFEVRPRLGGLRCFKGTVPVGKGTVTVTANEARLTVLSTVDGGQLIKGNESIPLAAGQELVIENWQ